MNLIQFINIGDTHIVPKQATPPVPKRETPPVPKRETPPVPKRETPPVPKRATPPVTTQVTPPVTTQVTPPVTTQVTPPVPKQAALQISLDPVIENFNSKVYTKDELKQLFKAGYNYIKQDSGITMTNLNSNICFTLSGYNFIMRLRYLLYAEIDNLLDINDIKQLLTKINLTSTEIDNYNKYLITQSFIELMNKNKFTTGNIDSARVNFIRKRVNQIKFYSHTYTYIIRYLVETFEDIKNICGKLNIIENNTISTNAKTAKQYINNLYAEFLFNEETYIKNKKFDKQMFLDGPDGIEEYMTNINNIRLYCNGKNMTLAGQKIKEIIDVIDYYKTNDTLMPGIKINNHSYYDPKVYKNIFMLNSTCKEGGSALTTSSFVLGILNSDNISIVNLESLSIPITTGPKDPITGLITPIPIENKVDAIYKKLRDNLKNNIIQTKHYLVLEITIKLEYILQNVAKFKLSNYTMCGMLLKCGKSHALFATCYDTDCDNNLFTVINDNMRLPKDIKNYAQNSNWGPFCSSNINTITTEALIYEISTQPVNFLLP